MTLTFGSLFAGIGGFDLGFERAGMQCKWQVEIDDYCNRVLEKHWPNVRRWPDVRTWPQPDTERVDVICGGFPCQDISVAGNAEGLEGQRSGLWFDFARIIRELGPRFVVVENVAALRIRGLDRVLGTLANLGYDAEWSTVSACSLGAPHTRERLFIIAYRREIRWNWPGRDTNGRNGVRRRFGDWKASPSSSQWRDVECWIKSVVEDGGKIIPPAERGGMADGIRDRLDRIGGCGNAVVPQVAHLIGELITKGLQDGE